jgi:DnaJ-class molecular chaperone
MKKNFYQILGVDVSASKEDVKLAYRKLAVKVHPDKQHGSALAEESFKELSEAYLVLSDPNLRSKYDSAQKRTTDEHFPSSWKGIPSHCRKDPSMAVFVAAQEGRASAILSAFKGGGRVRWRNPY